MAVKLDPQSVTEKLLKLAPQYVANIRKCTLGSKSKFYSPQYGGPLVVVCFLNVQIPDGVILDHMIDLVTAWCNLPKQSIVRFHVVFGDIFQVWTYSHYLVQVQKRMVFFPCFKPNSSIQIVSQTNFETIVLLP